MPLNLKINLLYYFIFPSHGVENPRGGSLSRGVKRRVKNGIYRANDAS